MEWMGTERVRGYLLVKVKPARNNFNPGMDNSSYGPDQVWVKLLNRS